MSTVIELPSTELIEASSTAEWFVRPDWTPPAMPTMELPALTPVRRPRHPYLGVAIFLLAMSGCIALVTYAATRVPASDPVKTTPIILMPKRVPATTATTVKAVTIPTVDVNDLPRAKRR